MQSDAGTTSGRQVTSDVHVNVDSCETVRIAYMQVRSEKTCDGGVR